MCGITGYISPDAVAAGGIEAMTDSLAHRGPDGRGVWLDPRGGAALGHRRLAILELSPLGRQPMASACGRYVICYNGEVYNYRALRAELEPLGHAFRGGSDTEVILAAMAQWGVADAVRRFVGMFAFALWDRQERELFLVRDRLGIKPLYYGSVGSALVFGSELKALRAFPGFEGTIDRGALSLYFRHNYIPGPHSIYQGVHKLEPGRILRVKPGGQPVIEAYWSAEGVWAEGLAHPFAGTEAEAADRLEALLLDAVGMRMVSDVPLGAFLSGGIDSSLVVALMQAQSDRPVKTFSIGFHERGFNEATYAKAVAAHLGTDHTELYLTPADMLAVIPRLPRHWDEPFSDSSQIPTYCVSELARSQVTVSLSGDGGDELFTGYDRYFWSRRVQAMLAVPLAVRRSAAWIGSHLPPRAFDLLGPVGRKIAWRLDGLGCRDFRELYRFLVSHHKNPAGFVIGGHEPETALTREGVGSGDVFHRMTLWDTMTYLPDDILTKVDRASMAVSLEARVPLLDHRVVEFAAALPGGMKVREGQGKQLLRRVLARHVPTHLVDRPKMGFGVPVAHWLAHDLRDWSESLLDRARLRRQGYLDPDAVRSMWKRFCAGDEYYSHFIWDILMFQAWLETQPGLA
jgi:asparagine synthase (glutamine-hydrolysing)